MPTPTSSSAHAWHTPINVGIATAQEIENPLSQLDAAETAGRALTTAETSRATGAEAAELARATAAEAAEISRATTAEATELARATTAETGLAAAILSEFTARNVAIAGEQAARVQGDIAEAAARIAAATRLDARIDTVVAAESTIGGTAVSTLTRAAGAATIASIGGDGTTTTVTTTGTHGYLDGDYITVAGTSTYNGDSPAINVLSTTQFTYPSSVNAISEFVGTVATRRIWVAERSTFRANMQITVTSDTGVLHATTVAGPLNGNTITLTDPIPTSWTGGARASVGRPVGTTLPEILLARTAIPSDGTLTLPTVLHHAVGGMVNVRAEGAKDDGSDDSAAIMAAVAHASGSADTRTVLFPPGEYVISSQTGTGTTAVASVIVANMDYIRFLGQPGSKLTIKDGAANRPLIFRNCDTVVVQGLEISYERTDGLSTDGLSIQNCANIEIDHTYVHDFPHYGIGVSERTDIFNYRANTISFASGTKRVSDTANGITGLSVGDTFYIIGSTLNDGKYTVAAVGAGGSYVTVNETLVGEAAAALKTLVVDSDIWFSSGDRTIYNEGGGAFRTLIPGMLIAIAGSAHNDGTYTVVETESDGGDYVRVAESLVAENAGATVTVKIQASPTVNQVIATACNNLRITNNRIEHCGVYGIEVFPKVKSTNQLIAGNFVYECGNVSGVGAGIKCSQAYASSVVSNNIVAHCLIGIATGGHDSTLVQGNLILNFSCFGIATTIGRHFRYGSMTLDVARISGNVLAYTTDFASITPSTPDGTPFVSSKHVYAGININGLSEAGLQYRLLDITDNTLTNLPCTALGIIGSRTQMTGIKWTKNTISDCLIGALVQPVQSTATVTNGSAVITNIQSLPKGTPPTVKDTTAGWYEKSGIFIQTWADAVNTISVPDGTTVLSIDASARTMTLSNPVSVVLTSGGTPVVGAVTGTRISSAYPSGLEVVENIIRNGSSSGIAAGNLRVYATNGRILRNHVHNGGTYAIQLRGSGTLAEGNMVYGHNAPHTATNAPFLLDEAGTFTFKNNHLQSLEATAPAVSDFVNNNAAQSILGTGSISVVADSSNTSVPAIPKFLFSGVPSRLQQLGKIVATATWDPGSLANGATATTTVTASNAQAGRPVDVGFTGITSGAWQLSALVTSTNTVTVVLTNQTGGTVDLPSGALTVIVDQF